MQNGTMGRCGLRAVRHRRDGALPGRGRANVPECDQGGRRSAIAARDDARWPASRPCTSYAPTPQQVLRFAQADLHQGLLSSPRP